VSSPTSTLYSRRSSPPFVATDKQLAAKAAEVLLDRVYGRPKQTSEISGPDGSAITTDGICGCSQVTT
jgi:hypothetical protein